MHKRIISICFLLLLFSLGVLARNGSIQGVISDAGTGELIPFANISILKNNQFSDRGTVTDSKGAFSVNQLDPSVLLGQLSSDAIENIDVISVSSAKYDAQGKGGVIKAKAYRMFDELTESENLISVASKIETGVYLLSIPDLKESYDYLLQKGWMAILTDTFDYVYVLSVIVYKRVVTTLRYFIAFSFHKNING